MNATALYALEVSSQATRWTIFSNGAAIVGLYSHSGGGHAARPRGARLTADDLCREAGRQLAEYFAGDRQSFDLALAPAGSDFDKRVWQALLQIPYGATISYGELARRIGSPNAARAVGAANGRNPIGLVIPCHRVIGANGRHVGYGGGLPLKAWLIEHEAIVRSQSMPSAAAPEERRRAARQRRVAFG